MRKKKIYFLLTAMLILLNIVFHSKPRFKVALEGQGLTDTKPIVSSPEEKRWAYRIKDGREQKRLWSITYDKWLTEWIDVRDLKNTLKMASMYFYFS